MEGILLLNATYEPLSVLSLRRAAKLWCQSCATTTGSPPMRRHVIKS